MVKGWYRESRRHSLASRGIKTATDKSTAMNKVPLMSREQRIDYLIDELNQSKFRNNGIRNVSFAKRLMNERMSDEDLSSEVFSNLSKDKSSGVLFKEQLNDPTLPIVFVDINYLKDNSGNSLYDDNIEYLDSILDIGKKLDDVPIFDVKKNEVSEGNHRVFTLWKRGYKSVPVRLYGSWD